MLFIKTYRLYRFICLFSSNFYVRDYLHNILGIVDQNGKPVVKYNYDAYGNRKGIEDTKDIIMMMIQKCIIVNQDFMYQSGEDG